MKKLMKKLWEKKDSKKGFTLVELIVVLVILAILAAIMVPSLVGWIDKAREKQHILEARNVYLATQTVVFERAKAPSNSFTDSDGKIALTSEEIISVNDLTKLTTADQIDTIIVDEGGVIKEFKYSPSGYEATFKDEAWTIKKSN